MERLVTTSTTVKICGIRTIPMIVALSTLAVDDIGFVFAPSKRTVTAEFAGKMIGVLGLTGSLARTVGVFVNPSIEELTNTLQSAPLDVLQFHGQESPKFCLDVKEQFQGITISKVFTVTGNGDSDQVTSQLEPYRGVCDSILLDTHDPLVGGGTGRTFKWEHIPTYQAWTAEVGIPLIVAGGLKPENVSELLEQYHPDGVDVSSGVETDGVKDILKIKAFIERVKHSDQQRT